MIVRFPRRGPFPSAQEDAATASSRGDTPQTMAPSYRLAFMDHDFLLREELRPVRLQLELMKPEMIQQEQNIESTVVVYGSARFIDSETAGRRLEATEAEAAKNPSNPVIQKELAEARRAVANSKYYDEARKLAALISKNCQGPNKITHVIITGGGPGVMEAANRGAHDVGAKNIGLNIVIPLEQGPNAYVTPELCFQFHYFAIRKMHFLIRAKALAAFPGGFGTMDELFETLTLIQTRKVKKIPILLFGTEFWKKAINFEAMVEFGTIAPEDLKLFKYVDTAEQAWEEIAKANGLF